MAEFTISMDSWQRLKELATLPEVSEESSDCAECGDSVEWRGDDPPDIGDHMACDECIAKRFHEMARIIEQCHD